MKRLVIYAKRAEFDLDDIADYYEEHAGIDVARMVIAKIISDAERLCRYPKTGTIRPDIEYRGSAVRMTTSNPYLIFYVFDESEVKILRVFHGKRDVDEMRIGD